MRMLHPSQPTIYVNECSCCRTCRPSARGSGSISRHRWCRHHHPARGVELTGLGGAVWTRCRPRAASPCCHGHPVDVIETGSGSSRAAIRCSRHRYTLRRRNDRRCARAVTSVPTAQWWSSTRWAPGGGVHRARTRRAFDRFTQLRNVMSSDLVERLPPTSTREGIRAVDPGQALDGPGVDARTAARRAHLAGCVALDIYRPARRRRDRLLISVAVGINADPVGRARPSPR